MAEEKDVVPPKHVTLEAEEENAPKVKASERNGFNDWGQPLNITIPAPFADVVRKMVQKKNERFGRGKWGGKGRGHNARGRGCSPNKNGSKFGNRGKGGRCQEGHGMGAMRNSRRKNEHKGQGKKDGRGISPQGANVSFDRMRNGDPVITVDIDLNQMQRGVEPQVPQTSAAENETPIMIGAEDDEVEENEANVEVPKWLRNQIKKARGKADRMPAWLKNILEKVDDAIDQEEGDENKKETNEVEAEDKLSANEDNMPVFTKLGALVDMLDDKKEKKMKDINKKNKPGKILRKAFKSMKRNFKNKKHQRDGQRQMQERDIQIPFWLRNIVQQAAGLDLQEVLNNNEEGDGTDREAEEEAGAEELSQEELLQMYAKEKKPKDDGEDDKNTDKDI